MTKLKSLLLLLIFLSFKPVSGVELVKGDNPVDLHILLQLRWIDYGETHTSIYGSGKVYSGFSARRGQIRLEGSLDQENIRWALMVDPIALSNKITLDAFISLEYLPFLDLKLGQFKYPQNLDGRLSESKLFLIRRSMLGRTFGAQRDVGIYAGHDFEKFEYAVALINGAGQNNSENNDKKDFAGRILLKPIPYVSFGGSIYRGRQPSGVTERTGAELQFNYKKLTLQSEYQAGQDSSLERWGLYLQGAYLLGKHFQPCLRGEIWEPAKDNIKDKFYIASLGFSWLLKGENTKISFNYILVTEEENETDNNEFLMQWLLRI